MNQTHEIVQDEFNIRELLETLWKGKIFIAIVTAVAIFISIIASFFIISKQYEASAELTVSPIVIKLSVLQDSASIVDYLATMPIKTKVNYLQEIKSSIVLEDTIKKLELKDASGSYISVNSLSNLITVTDVVNTNLIQITVKNEDPEKAALIANTISHFFSEYVAGNTKTQIQQAADSIAKQLSDEETVLQQKKTALDEFRLKNGTIDVLKGDETSLIGKIVSYKDNLQDTVTQIDADTATLQVLESTAQSTDIIPSQDYNLSIDLNNDPENIGQNQVNVSPDNLQKSLLTVNISTIQTRLVSNFSKKQVLEKRIPELETSLTDTQALITENEYKYNAVSGDMLVAQITYGAYLQRNREATSYSKSDIGKTIITVSSAASASGGPVSPNKKLNVAIAGILGICLSVFIVLFRNYWRRTKVSPTK